MCYLAGYSLNKHPSDFPWEDIGLKYIPDALPFSFQKKGMGWWTFRVVDKNKLAFAIIKYNLDLFSSLDE